MFFISTNREFWNNRNNNPGDVVSGRYVQDLPSKKIAEVEKNAKSAFCSPANCLQDVHKLVNNEDKNEESQETIIKSKLFFRSFSHF